MRNFDELWARLTRVAAFIVGMGIMVFETVGDKSDRPWLYAAAIGMMGLPIAREAEQIIGRFGNKPGPTSGMPEKHNPQHAEPMVEGAEGGNQTNA